MELQEMKAIAKVVADWWVSQLSPIPGSDNGDKSENGIWLMALRTLAAKTVNPESAAQFGMNLYDEVLKALKTGENYIYFGVDYHPDGMLREAIRPLEQADAIVSQLPIKTAVSIDDGIVRVKRGYGAPWQTIYPAQVEPDSM